MNHHRWGILFGIILIVSLAAIGYLLWGRLGSDSPRPAGLLAADKTYGVSIDLTHYETDSLPEIFNSLRENNLTWLRQPVNWADIEPAPGQFNWQQLDQIFTALTRHNQTHPPFKIIAVLQTSPAWARPDQTPPMTPPAEVSDFGRFAHALATRYGAQIDAYQIWHEPNLSANWGNAYVDPIQYNILLREASLNIKEVQPQAVILTAALAPTLENGPLNLNEPTYLDQLYHAQTGQWFDAVAGQAYGFDSEPGQPAHPGILNFSRITLLRDVMLGHGDADTPIWATAFGWNALPRTWDGQPSPWKSNTPAIQAQRTADALAYARREWPWLGPMLAIRWDAAGLAGNDPARGFALSETPEIAQKFQAAAAQTIATPGRYPADHPSGQTGPGWRFARGLADVPRHEPRALTILFEGTRLDLSVNRGPYKGYLWITIDGQPANALPQNNQGQSYVVLYDPLHKNDTVTLAQNLPYGRHTAVIEADGGWGQWAIAGWTVFNEPASAPPSAWLILTGALVVVSGAGLLWSFRPVLIALLIWAKDKVEQAITRYNKLGEASQLALTIGLALVFYFAPGPLALLLLPAVALAIFLRPDFGLMLIAFSLSFFQAPKQLPLKSFSPVELGLLLTTLGFIFREGLKLTTLPRLKLRSMDWAALLLAALGLLATLAAPNFGVSMHEWRLVVAEAVIFYFLVRLGRDYSPLTPSNWRKAWRLVDALVAGAAFHALLALALYFFTNQSITAEGVRRALGPVYGSPNNLSLFLDRAWPILLAVALFPDQTAGHPGSIRRGLYGGGLALVSLTLLLTFSKGALLLGLPAAIIVMTILFLIRHPSHRRRIVGLAAGLFALLAMALVPLSQTERFRTTFNFDPGSTGFFRLKLWEASLNMLRDHWPLGVGLDNFLYQYRTRYILPEAWAEPNLSHPHNLILDFGTRLGIGGIVWLVGVQLVFWINSWRLYTRIPASLLLGLMGSMAVFLSHGLVDNSLFLVDLAFVFFLTAGILQNLGEKHPISL